PSPPTTHLSTLSLHDALPIYAAISEPYSRRLDIVDFPTKNRALQRRKIWHLCHSNPMPTHAQNQGKLVLAHKIESQFAFIEGPGLVVVSHGNKSDHLS